MVIIFTDPQLDLQHMLIFNYHYNISISTICFDTMNNDMRGTTSKNAEIPNYAHPKMVNDRRFKMFVRLETNEETKKLR